MIRASRMAALASLCAIFIVGCSGNDNVEADPTPTDMGNGQDAGGGGDVLTDGGAPDVSPELPDGGEPDAKDELRDSGTPDAPEELPDSGVPDGSGELPDGGEPDGGDEDPDGGGGDGGDEPVPVACDTGIIVVGSNYFESSITLLNLDGTISQENIVTSNSSAPGMDIPLSGDVDVPGAAPASGKIVVLDRYQRDVVTLLDRSSGDALAQLFIGHEGFTPNPQDYIEVDEDRAFISRYESNSNPGAEDYDEGGDLLIVDTESYEMIGRIAMPEDDDELSPRPAKMTKRGDEVIVTLQRFSRNFRKVGEGRFVGVSPATHTVEWTVDIPGMANCGKVVASPSGERLAIACSGAMTSTGGWEKERSGVVLFDATTPVPTEIQRFDLGNRLGTGLTANIAFASEELLLGNAYGVGAGGDMTFSLDISTGDHEVIHEAGSSYVLEGIYCAPGCGDICVLADADQGVMRRWGLDAEGNLEELEPVSLSGLPPRTLGAL